MATFDSPEGFADIVTQLTDALGFRLESITPADDPAHAVLRHGDVMVDIARATRRRPASRWPMVPDLEPELVIIAGGDSHDQWVTGRAGMRYRDLIPSRLGGRFIASNIEVCEGGPVPDLVHHHAIRFQLIACQTGWVDVVYQDQGPPFRMNAGDLVLQPPHIRHRVLASSAGARVVEIGCPAEHDTLFDYDVELPNDGIDRDRSFGGQRFVRHVGAEAAWHPVDASERTGVTRQITDVARATDDLANVEWVRIPDAASHHSDGSHHEFDFRFVLGGTASIEVGGTSCRVETGGAVTVPPGVASTCTALGDAEVLHVLI